MGGEHREYPEYDPRTIRRNRRLAWMVGTAAMLLFVVLLAPYRATVDEVHVVLPMLLLLLVASSVGGERLGFFLATIGFVAIDVIFQPPFGQFSLNKPHDLTVLIAFFVTAAISTRLLVRAQDKAAEAYQRSVELQQMADLGAEMLSTVSPAEALERVAVATCDLLGAQGCRIVRGAPGEAGEVVALVTRTPDPVDRVTHPGPLSFPLHADGGQIGEMTVEGVNAMSLRETRTDTLRAMAHYAAIGLDRMRLAADAAHADELRQADRMKDMVLASVSHDLRTPLTTIKLLAASLVRRGEGAAEQIEEEADRLSRMVGDLLDLSRARAGELALNMDVNTLEDLIGAAMRQLAPILGARPVVRMVADDEGPLVGRFDFVASLRVVVNLVENAAKYSPPGSPIELEARREQDQLVIEVRDRGRGVADDDLGRIFIPFFRSSNALYDTGGAGLGLPTARVLAEAQGGTVTYRPREGGGSVFTFTLMAMRESLTSVLDEQDGAS